MSQLEFALEADVSQRHISFLESGRSRPSRDMVLHLAQRHGMPLRERNVMLLAAGYAPVFPERRLDDPDLEPARQAIDLILTGHEPFPALAVDRHWRLVAANRAVAPLLSGVADPALLEPPVNVLRLSLHPLGLAPRIANLPEWRAHLLERLRQQIAITGDPALSRLMGDLAAYPVPEPARKAPAHCDYAGIAVPLDLLVGDDRLSLLSATTVFGTPLEVTLSELALESFFPADAATAAILQRFAADRARDETRA